MYVCVCVCVCVCVRVCGVYFIRLATGRQIKGISKPLSVTTMSLLKLCQDFVSILSRSLTWIQFDCLKNNMKYGSLLVVDNLSLNLPVIIFIL